MTGRSVAAGCTVAAEDEEEEKEEDERKEASEFHFLSVSSLLFGLASL